MYTTHYVIVNVSTTCNDFTTKNKKVFHIQPSTGHDLIKKIFHIPLVTIEQKKTFGERRWFLLTNLRGTPYDL